MVTRVGKNHSLHILPLPAPVQCCKTLSSNTSLHFIIFWHFRTHFVQGCLSFHMLSMPITYTEIYIFEPNAAHALSIICSIKMTAHIWLLPNSLTWFADFVFSQNWGFQCFYLLWQAIKYISAKHISRKAHFSSKTMFIAKKCFKIFKGVFLWPIFIVDTPFRARRHGLHRFLNGLQTIYKR